MHGTGARSQGVAVQVAVGCWSTRPLPLLESLFAIASQLTWPSRKTYSFSLR